MMAKTLDPLLKEVSNPFRAGGEALPSQTIPNLGGCPEFQTPSERAVRRCFKA